MSVPGTQQIEDFSVNFRKICEMKFWKLTRSSSFTEGERQTDWQRFFFRARSRCFLFFFFDFYEGASKLRSEKPHSHSQNFNEYDWRILKILAYDWSIYFNILSSLFERTMRKCISVAISLHLNLRFKIKFQTYPLFLSRNFLEFE